MVSNPVRSLLQKQDNKWKQKSFCPESFQVMLFSAIIKTPLISFQSGVFNIQMRPQIVLKYWFVKHVCIMKNISLN